MTVLQMHRYVLGWLGIFTLFSVTLPIAMLRVSQTETFAEQPFNSLTCEGKTPHSRLVVKFQTCAQMQTQPVHVPYSLHSPEAVQIIDAAQVTLPLPASSQPSNPTLNSDPFTTAIHLAEQAVAIGKTASNQADWYNAALQWRQAENLMSQVAPEDSRYSIAQKRILFYQQNRQIVLQQAEREPIQPGS